MPLPPRLEIGPATGVIGRDTEAALLADAFKRVAAGEGREVVLVSGEAGIGKTTLAAQAARAAFEAGAVVLLGRCDEDLGAPYGPFVEALSHYVTHAPEEALRAHVQSLGARARPDRPRPRASAWGSCPRPRAPTPTPSATSSTTRWSGCSARCRERHAARARARRPAVGGQAEPPAAAPRGGQHDVRCACSSSAPIATRSSRAPTR